MPTYQVECHECGLKEDRRLTFSVYDSVLKGEKELECTRCRKLAVLSFSPGEFGFILKEGESGGWASKSMKEKTYRDRRAKIMDRRKRDHVPTSQLQPNYRGQETGTWREAQEAARRDKGELSASTYQGLVSKEVS